MAVELPEPLQWVLLLLAGTRWPEADEDQLRHMAEHCRTAAESVKDAAQSADSTIKRALDGQQGAAAEALSSYWEKKYSVGEGSDKPGALPATVDSLNGMGDMLENMANSAETAKIQIIAQLGILAFELATAEAEAPFTAGASLLQVPVMIGASRAVVQQILKQLLKETLEMAAKQAAQMGAINLLAQGIEVAEGHRKSIDMKELGQNALGGAVGGASAHLIGKGIGAAGKKIGAENALNSTVGKIGTGAAIGVGADVSTQLITTGQLDSGSLLGSGLSGGAGAGLHAGASAIKTNMNVPKPVDAPKLDLPDTAGTGHDTPPTFTKSTSSSDDSTYRGPSGTTSGDSAEPAPNSGSTSGAGFGAGAGAAAGAGLGSTVDAGSSSGHTTTTGAGESKVNGLAPFGSDRSTGTTVGTTAAPAPHETAGPAPHEQTGTRAQEPAISGTDSRTAAPNTETEPTMVRSVHPTTGQPHETPTPQPHESPTVQPHETPVPHQESPAPRPEPVAVQPHETPVPQPHESPTVQPHETPVPHQESPAPRPEPVAVQPHETPVPQPHESPTVQPHETPVPHQESPAPRPEPVAVQPHETPVPQSHESPTVQPHETPVPHQESPAPRPEPVAVQPHETPTPQPHESPTVQPHETPAPHHEQVTPLEPVRVEQVSHETPVPHQEPVPEQSHGAPAPRHESAASQPHETPTVQPHETPVPHQVAHQEAPAPTDGAAGPRVTEQPVGATAAQQSSGVPNLSGVLGGAGSLAGAGGTHLDGGSRGASAPAPVRPAGPEQVPGQVLSDAVPDGTPSSTVTPPPMAGGGYLPGASSVGAGGAGRGGAGASGRPGGFGSVPRQDGHQQGSAGGSVRGGSGGSRSLDGGSHQGGSSLRSEHGVPAESSRARDEHEGQEQRDGTDRPSNDEVVPHVEPEPLPPVGTPEHGIMHDPAGFLADNLLSVDFSEGVKQRMPGLGPGQDIVFLGAMKKSDKHWFTMEPDPAPGHGGKPSYHLVPAWEKYAAHFAEHPESFPGLESFPEPLGAQLPPLKDDSHYVKGAYVPYEASERPGADSTIGHAEVPLHPDPNLPREGLVFTDAMNGCAFVATVKPGEDTFTAWHYQSYSASENLQAGADFRLGKTVTQWAGLHDYAAPLPPGHTPAATNMLRYNGHGWELISQETHANILDPNRPPRVSKQSTIPFEVTAQTPENLVKMTVDPYHVRAKQQLGQFQDAAHSLTKGLDQENHYVEELTGFIKTMSKRLEAQERRVAELQEPGKTLEDVRAAVTALREAEQKNREFLDKNEDHLKQLFEHATAAYPNRQPDTLISEFRKSDWIDVMRHESDGRQSLPPGSADTTSVQDLNSPAPSTRSLGDDGTPVPPSAPHPTADVQQGTSTRDFGSIPSRPAPTSQPTPEVHPSATAHSTGVPEPRQPRPTEATAPASDTRAVPPRRNADSDTTPSQQPAPSGSRKRGRDEDADSTPPSPTPSNSRKRGRDEDGDDQPVSEPTPEPKRRRTPSYENSDAVMQDRGFRAVGAHDPLTQDLVSHLGGEAKAHPPVSPELLGKVNPHAAPVHPGEGFRVGDDLNACMENVEAYRDTHFGRPRVAGQTLHGDVEQNPGSTLWKRHDSPALFGEGADAIPKLMETVRDGGPGSFATVLGAGKEGTGHVVALVHGDDGQLRWADLSDHRVTPADGGMPENFRPDWTVWASVADPHENNISGPHDPNFVDNYSGFTRPADAPAPEPVAAGGSGRPQPPAAGTSGSLPPVGRAGGAPRAEGDQHGFGSDLRTGPPTGQQGTGHAGPSTASVPHTSDQPAASQHGSDQHGSDQHEQVQQQTDQQQHDDGAAPSQEPLLPPDDSPEYGLVHDPVEFLTNTPVSVSFDEGVLQRTPGLKQKDVADFVTAMERSPEHWFTLERDPNSGPDQEAYILTPAWEKYVAHDKSLPKQPGEKNFPEPSNGVALPDPKPDHEYIRAGYFPYKSGSMRDEANIGNTVVVREPDPARPGDSLVFTGGMNGCGLAITDVGPDSFKVWHVQSYSALSNLGPAARFRVKHPVTDWFGIDEYLDPHQKQDYAVTNVLRHGPAGWEVISQEVVKTPDNHHIGRPTTTRPLKLDRPTGEEFTRRTMVLYDSVPAEQARRFERNAEWLLRDVPEGWMQDAISKEVDGLRERLVAQEQTFASLRRPDLTVQELHAVAGILKTKGEENQKAAKESEILMEAILRMVYQEPASGTYAFKGQVSSVVEEFKFDASAAWIDGLHSETSAYLKPEPSPESAPEPSPESAPEPSPEPAPESAPSSESEPAPVPRSGFGSVPAPATDRAPVRGDDTPPARTPEPRDPDGPTSPVEHRADADGTTAREQVPNPRKRGREDEENEQDGPTTAPADKRRRTPEYENSQAVMGDRGYERIGPEHPLTGELVNYLGGAPKLHPPMSNSLLQKVNPHQEPTNPAADFRSGNDLNACLENVEAYRDTHFGRPRVSGQTVHGTVEPIPGNTLWKRHDGPALFGQGPDAVQKLMDTVQAGGPGSFATVLGAGPSGTGHAVALVHDRDGTLRWADLTDRKVAAANGTMPDNFRPDWTVWASVADPRENNISGPHDPLFMERFSTSGESAHPSDPTDTGTFGAPHQADPNAIELTPLPVHPSTPERGEFPPAAPRVQVPGDGLCLLHSIAVGTPGAAVSRGTAEQFRSTVENHFATLRPEQWPTEIVSNHRNDLIAQNALGPGNPLGLSADRLQTLSDHSTGTPPPPSAAERAALLDTVRNWEDRWGSNAGEMLPPAAAHALGLNLRVVDHDGVTRAVFGPADGRQVTVYHQGNHYDGSRPVPPVAEQQPPSHPAPEQQKAPEQKAPEQKAPEQKAPEGKQQEKAPEQKAPEAEQQNTDGPEGKEVPPRPIEGSDLVVGLTKDEKELRDKVIDVLNQAVPGNKAAVRTFADTHFGPATLRPMLRAFSRGDSWTVPFEGDGWSGDIKLSGQVVKTFEHGIQKLEFENGGDLSAANGSLRDSQRQHNIGFRARHGVDLWEPTEMAGYYHDRGHSEVAVDLGGMVARSKTVQDAELYESTMRLEVDFGGLRHEDAPVRTASGGRTVQAELGVTVAVPVQTRTGPEDEQRTPPQRLLDGRVGGQEIVLDMAPRGVAEGRQPVEALLEHVEQAARQEFGDRWPAMRERVLSEVDFDLLQQNLKSMTAGEPVTVTLTDEQGRRIGTVEIGARVGDLHQTGTTKETEFNIGTAVQQVRSSVTNEGNAGQLGLTEVFRPGYAVAGGGGAKRLGRDHVEIVGESRVSQLTSKSKVPAVIYDGAVRFALSFNGKPETHEAGSADVRLLVDQADTRPPAAKDSGSTPPEGSGSTPPKDQPEKQPKDQPEKQPKKKQEDPEVPAPPDSVWAGGNDRGGLDETVVVRDLESTAALRSAIDAAGRERFRKDWDGIRDQVLRSFSQPNLAARLTGMTRGEPLVVKVPGKEDLVIRAVAKVEGMTYRREDGKAELNPLNETSTFRVGRRLQSDTTIGTAEAGVIPVQGTPGFELAAVGTGQQRERKGGQGRQADRVYANGKYGAPQVIYGADLSVEVSFGRPGDKAGDLPTVSAPVRVEVGVDARETAKVRAPRGEDGSVTFARPATPAPAKGTPAEPRNTVQRPKPTATHTAPPRMLKQKEVNASYVVHTLRGADQVLAKVKGAIRDKHGEPSAKVEERLDTTLDRIALKTQLSPLTRGSKITETVSGPTWKAEITVRARVKDANYHSSTEKYEFESGTRTSSGQGNVRDTRRRLFFGTRFKVKTPVLDVLGAYAHRSDHSQGRTAESVGSASNRGKHVEPAVFFDVETAYDVTVKFTRLGVPDGTVTETVDTVARVAVPTRDAQPVAAPGKRPDSTEPVSFAGGRRRLDSSAIITDVYIPSEDSKGSKGSTGSTGSNGPKVSTAPNGSTAPAGQSGSRQTFGEAVLSQVESGWKPDWLKRVSGKTPKQEQKSVSNPFRSDWSGLRSKLDRELTPDRLQSRLKGMTAGDEIVVRHGRTTVRVRAVLRDRMDHLGSSGTTEFNTGTDVQRTFADVDATGQGHHGLLGITGSAPVPGAPVSLTPGLTGTGGRGREQVEVHNSSVSSGMATKAKLPGSAYQGEAELQFTFERRPWIGASVFRSRTAVIGFESIVETAGTVPVPATKSDAADGDGKAVPAGEDGKPAATEKGGKPAATEKEPVETIPLAFGPTSISIPPERVWKNGLRDTDVLRFLDDVGGVQDLVRLRGPEYFGRSAWEKMEPQTGKVTKYANLSALFTAASHGTPESEGKPGAGTPKEGAPKEETPTEGAPKEGAPTEGAPTEETPKEETPTEGAKTAPVKRVLFGRDKGVEFDVRMVSLEHRTNDEVGELSPANSASGGSLGYALSSGDAGAQAQFGAKITGASSFTNTPAIIGGSQHAWRAGGGHGGSGQIVSNGKIPFGAARYHGYAEVEVTFFDGDRQPLKEKGLIPVTLDIPLTETSTANVPVDHYLSFGPAHPTGELHYGEARLLDEVHRVLGGDQPYDPAKATPAEHRHLTSTVQLGRAVYGADFTAGTEADRGRVQAVHQLVKLGGGTSLGAADLLGGLLGAPKGGPLPAATATRAIDYLGRRAAEAARPLGAPGRTAGDGPFTLEDLVLGAHDGWPEQEQYDVHRETWTDRGPASGLVTSAMATAADAARALPGDGTPAGGKLSLTVLGEDAGLLLSRRFQLDGGDVAEQIRKFEEQTYLKPGTAPSEVIVQLTPAPETSKGAPEEAPEGADGNWDYLVTARPGGDRELTLRHRKPAGAQPQDGQPQDAPSGGAPLGDAEAARVAAAWQFAAGRGGSPEASG